MSDVYAPFESLKFDYPAERVLRIRLDNPGKLNAVDARMHRELADVWRAVDTDRDVSAVILTGAGDAFSAGGDFDVLEDLCKSQETRLAVWKEARDIVYNVINCSKPIISAIRGPAVGAGLAAALVADISVASKTARFIDLCNVFNIPVVAIIDTPGFMIGLKAELQGTLREGMTALVAHRLIEQGLLVEWPLTCQVAAVAVGLAGGEAVADLDYGEDLDCDVDLNLVYSGDGRLVEASGTLNGAIINAEDVEFEN